MTWNGSVPTFSPGKVSSSDLQQLADIATHLAQYMTDGAWSTYTPVVSGGGTAVVSITGRYKRIAPRTVLVRIAWTVTTAGSGSSNVGVTLPTEPNRSTRQLLNASSEVGTALSGVHALVITSGSGSMIDRIRYAGDTNLVGSAMTNGKIFSIQGFYEEAS